METDSVNTMPQRESTYSYWAGKLRPYISNTPLWPVAREIKDSMTLRTWERNGRPAPPPSGYKRQVIRQYAKKYGVSTMIETGTLYGEMDIAMKDVFSSIFTIELSPEFHAAAVRRMAPYPHIKCLQGDSAVVFPSVLAQMKSPCLLWLDAHYSAGNTAKAEIDTPISAELDYVFNHPIRNHVVLIDDAHCFDGTHDYPQLKDLEESVLRVRPDLSFTVEHNIIRIVPRTDSAN